MVQLFLQRNKLMALPVDVLPIKIAMNVETIIPGRIWCYISEVFGASLIISFPISQLFF